MATAIAATNIKEVLSELGIKETNSGASTGSNWLSTNGEKIDSVSPVDAQHIASVTAATIEDYNKVVDRAHEGFLKWRKWTAPQRGEVVRQLGIALREKKEPLGQLVSYEMGKSYQEGLVLEIHRK